MAQSVEVLLDPRMADRGQEMIQAMIDTCPLRKRLSNTYTGTCDLLLTYGTGHPIRRPWWQKHRAKGKHCIGLDLGYTSGYMRITLDDDHPHKWVREEPADRWERLGIELREDFSEDGPGIVVGLGRKAVKCHGYKPLEWERGAADSIRSLGKKPAYRPKKKRDPVLPGMPILNGTIEEALKGASLVVCRHSNVAIDACIAGIPVMCEDGIALSLYKDNTNPSREERLRLLHSMAYWQWKPSEAKQAWKYILNRLG